MRLSERGLAFIAMFEGFRARAYKPVPGEQFLTIGYGHYGPDVNRGSTITRAGARRLLRRDATGAADAVRRYVNVPIDQCEFDALVSLAFNIGPTAFKNSTVLRQLNRNRRYLAGAAFLMWIRGANGPLEGLRRRRRAERRLFRGKGRVECGNRARV